VNGRFITFEGTEGCGKSTQLRLLAERWTTAGRDVVCTREPGGTEIGRALRGLLLRPTDQPMAAETELLLYTADRAQHLTQVIQPALARGALVLCDRYLDATVAYQGYGRGLSVETIERLHELPPLDRRPDRTLWIDIDPAEGLQRARSRDAQDGCAAAEGRFEAETLAFHRRVHDGYRALARREPRRIHVVDGHDSIETVHARVCAAIDDLLEVPS